jgi:hypothetical protein
MVPVLGGKDDLFGGQLPVNPDIWIVPCDGTLRLRMIEIVALILEHALLGKDAESMGESPGHKKLKMILFTQLHREVLPISRRILSDIYCNVENTAFYDPYKLCLGKGVFLEMKATEDPVGGFTLIVLDKVDFPYFISEFSKIEGLEKIASRVSKDSRFDD